MLYFSSWLCEWAGTWPDQILIHAWPSLDHASTDDKWIFGQVKQVHNGYEIQTKYGILDRNFPTFELMHLPSTINLEIPLLAPDHKITLHAVAAWESTMDKVPVVCKCRDKCSWCSVWRYAYFKAGVKCGVACYGEEDGWVNCLNIAASTLHSQKGLQVRDKDEKGESSKRHRKNTTGGEKK